MSDLRRQLNEDRAIRDAAHSIVQAQIAQVKNGISGEKLGQKLAENYADPALERLETARLPTKLIAAAIAGAASVIGVALAWKPLASLFDESDETPVSENKNDA